MRARRFTLTGKTDSNGKLLIYNQSEMMAFFTKWVNHSFTMEINLSPVGTSDALMAYYYRSVVPDFQQAFKDVDGERMTLTAVDLKLRELSSVMHEEIPSEESGGFDLIRLLSIQEAGNHRSIEFIEDLKVIGSIKYGVSISDPHTL